MDLISFTVEFATLRTNDLEEPKMELKPTGVVKYLTFSNLFEGFSVMDLIFARIPTHRGSDVASAHNLT